MEVVFEVREVVRSDDPLTLEEMGSLITAVRMFSRDLVGEGPYIDALARALAKLEALVEEGKQPR